MAWWQICEWMFSAHIHENSTWATTHSWILKHKTDFIFLKMNKYKQYSISIRYIKCNMNHFATGSTENLRDSYRNTFILCSCETVMNALHLTDGTVNQLPYSRLVSNLSTLMIDFLCLESNPLHSLTQKTHDWTSNPTTPHRLENLPLSWLGSIPDPCNEVKHCSHSDVITRVTVLHQLQWLISGFDWCLLLWLPGNDITGEFKC